MNFRKTLIATAVAGAFAVMSHAALAQYTGATIQGPSSSQTPYNQGIAGYNITSILTTGDSVGGYRMGGIPDGLGAYDNGNGTFTLLSNHELYDSWGVARSGGAIGAYVSKLVINKSDFSVVSGSDFLSSNANLSGTVPLAQKSMTQIYLSGTAMVQLSPPPPLHRHASAA